MRDKVNPWKFQYGHKCQTTLRAHYFRSGNNPTVKWRRLTTTCRPLLVIRKHGHFNLSNHTNPLPFGWRGSEQLRAFWRSYRHLEMTAISPVAKSAFRLRIYSGCWKKPASCIMSIVDSFHRSRLAAAWNYSLPFSDSLHDAEFSRRQSTVLSCYPATKLLTTIAGPHILIHVAIIITVRQSWSINKFMCYVFYQNLWRNLEHSQCLCRPKSKFTENFILNIWKVNFIWILLRYIYLKTCGHLI